MWIEQICNPNCILETIPMKQIVISLEEDRTKSKQSKSTNHKIYWKGLCYLSFKKIRLVARFLDVGGFILQLQNSFGSMVSGCWRVYITNSNLTSTGKKWQKDWQIKIWCHGYFCGKFSYSWAAFVRTSPHS